MLFPVLRAALPEIGLVIDELIRDHAAMRQAVPQLEAGTGVAKLDFRFRAIFSNATSAKKSANYFHSSNAILKACKRSRSARRLEKILAGGAAR